MRLKKTKPKTKHHHYQNSPFSELSNNGYALSLCEMVTQDPFLISPSHLAYEFISLDWFYFPQYATVMELHGVTKRDVAVPKSILARKHKT